MASKQQPGIAEAWVGSVTAALIRHAEELSRVRGHSLGKWNAAKRKLGRAALKATCHGCGGTLIIMPLGDGRHVRGQIASAPGMRGEVLEGCCAASGDRIRL